MEIEEIKILVRDNFSKVAEVLVNYPDIVKEIQTAIDQYNLDKITTNIATLTEQQTVLSEKLKPIV